VGLGRPAWAREIGDAIETAVDRALSESGAALARGSVDSLASGGSLDSASLDSTLQSSSSHDSAYSHDSASSHDSDSDGTATGRRSAPLIEPWAGRVPDRSDPAAGLGYLFFFFFFFFVNFSLSTTNFFIFHFFKHTSKHFKTQTRLGAADGDNHLAHSATCAGHRTTCGTRDDAARG
jgi:hypothetical protein